MYLSGNIREYEIPLLGKSYIFKTADTIILTANDKLNKYQRHFANVILRQVSSNSFEVLKDKTGQFIYSKGAIMGNKCDFNLGDVVQLSKKWHNKIGIVKANDSAWWVLEKHYDIADCICKAEDVVRVIKRGVIKAEDLVYIS